jgi:prepilin-type N-terminal cleavage/methylation domain-containing protein
MPTNKLGKKQKGFTLIEIMAGMIVFSLRLLPPLLMLVTSLKANDFTGGSPESSMYINDKMEDLKNMDRPSAGADTVSTISRFWTVSSIGFNSYRLDVTLTRSDHYDRARSNMATSYFAKS